jgi:hypothetical protein
MLDCDDLFDDIPEQNSTDTDSLNYIGLASLKDYVDSENIDLPKLDTEHNIIQTLGPNPKAQDILLNWPEIIVNNNVNFRVACNVLPHEYII